MELSDEMLIEWSYVTISKYRARALKALEGEIKIPTQLAKDSDINYNHISTVLKQLKEHDLVECINPEVRKGRLYRQTEKGEIISLNIELE